MFNKVILVGNLTRDPELRYLPSGSAIATVGIATNRRFKKTDGTQGEEVCFVDISLFGRTAEVMNQYCKKGSKVLVEGRLKLDTWTDQSGQKRSKHSVVAESLQMLDTRGSSSDDDNQSDTRKNEPSKQNQAKQNIPEIDIDEEEIPF